MIVAIRHLMQGGVAYFVKKENEMLGTRDIEDATEFTQEEAEQAVKENWTEWFHSYCIKERETDRFVWQKNNQSNI